MRKYFRPLVLIGVVGAAAATGACANTETELRQWDEIQALGNAINEMKTYTNELENLVDSLHKIVMRQDTALRLIVDFTGAQVPAYRPPSP